MGDSREVAAGKRGFVGRGQSEQAVEEAMNPGGFAAGGRREFARKAQGEKGCNRTGAHCGKVA